MFCPLCFSPCIYGVIMRSGTKPLNICSVFFSCFFVFFSLPFPRRKASHGAARTPCISYSLTFRALRGSALLIELLLTNVLNLFLLVAGHRCFHFTETFSCCQHCFLPGFDCLGSKLVWIIMVKWNKGWMIVPLVSCNLVSLELTLKQLQDVWTALGHKCERYFTRCSRAIL